MKLQFQSFVLHWRAPGLGLAVCILISVQGWTQNITCANGEARRRIDPDGIAIKYSGHALETALGGLGEVVRFSAASKLLQEATDATQQWNELVKGLVAGYNGCVISKEQYAEGLQRIYPRLKSDATSFERIKQLVAEGKKIDQRRLEETLDRYFADLRLFANLSGSRVVEQITTAVELNAQKVIEAQKAGTERILQGLSTLKNAQEELAAFATGIAVEVGIWDASQDFRSVATGFWVSPLGFAATCLHPLQGSTFLLSSGWHLAVGVPGQPLLGSKLIVAGSVMHTNARVVAADEESDLAVLKIDNSPFERNLHMIAQTQDTGSGEIEKVTEKYWVPQLSTELSRAGEEVMVTSLDQFDGLPSLATDFGRVTRTGVDKTKEKKPLRIYTSLPFKNTDCGAPVVNGAKEIVGVMNGGSSQSASLDSHSVIVPSRYVRDLLDSSGIFHQ